MTGRNLPEDGWTKQELMDAAGLSGKTFDMFRKAARVRGPGHGGLEWVFSVSDLIELVHRAESGRFTERGGPAGEAWRVLLKERGTTLPPAKSRGRPSRDE